MILRLLKLFCFISKLCGISKLISSALLGTVPQGHQYSMIISPTRSRYATPTSVSASATGDETPPYSDSSKATAWSASCRPFCISPVLRWQTPRRSMTSATRGVLWAVERLAGLELALVLGYGQLGVLHLHCFCDWARQLLISKSTVPVPRTLLALGDESSTSPISGQKKKSKDP